MKRRITQVVSVRPQDNGIIYLAVLRKSRHYGGPEEGGWFYDVHELGEIYTADNIIEAIQIVRRLRDENPTCSRGRGSAIGSADVEICIAKDEVLLNNLNYNGYRPYC